VGVFLTYSVGPDGEITGGPDLATLSGWLAFLDWAEPLTDFPALSRFVEECVAWSAEEIDRLESELAAAVKAHAGTLSPEVLRTVGRLLEAIHDRPGGTVALVATDGTPGDDDDQDADDDADLDEDDDEDEGLAPRQPGPGTPAAGTPAAPQAKAPNRLPPGAGVSEDFY
jgi:hypothetical protein